MDALTQNALQTSEIEGEKLNVGSVRSSVAKHLGLEQAGLPSGTVQTENLIAMLGCDNATTVPYYPTTALRMASSFVS